MHKSIFHFIAKSKSFDLEITSENESDLNRAKFQILQAFFTKQNNDSAEVNIIQNNTDDLRNKIDSIVKNLSQINPRIFRLKDYFEKQLAANELFAVICDEDIDATTRNTLLAIFDNPEDMEKARAEADATNSIMAHLMSVYNIDYFGKETKEAIGEKDKSKRICRFCHKGYTETSFKAVAHTISEGLGNTSITTNTECDNCNQLFGSTIEQHFIRLFDIQRLFYQAHRKGGSVHKFVGKNYTIEKDACGVLNISIICDSDEISNTSNDYLKLGFDIPEPFAREDVYKTLCKYAMGVMPEDVLFHFEKLRLWLLGSACPGITPNIAIINIEYKEHPSIVLYTRKDVNNTELPYAVCEVRIFDIALVYIVPFSDCDLIDYSKQEEYEKFWSFFSIYSNVSGWRFKNFNGTDPIKDVLINFIKR